MKINFLFIAYILNILIQVSNWYKYIEHRFDQRYTFYIIQVFTLTQLNNQTFFDIIWILADNIVLQHNANFSTK